MTEGGESRREFYQQVVRVAGALTIGLYSVLGIILIFSLPSEERPPEARLFIVLAITMVTVIMASGATAMVYSALSRGTPVASGATVFRESIYRFAWLASPSAAGYGISEIVQGLVKLFNTGVAGP